jgi:hypothetical protein
MTLTAGATWSLRKATRALLTASPHRCRDILSICLSALAAVVALQMLVLQAAAVVALAACSPAASRPQIKLRSL